MALGGGGGIRQQIVLDGVDQIIRQLDRLGTTGEQSFNKIGTSAAKASTGINQFAAASTQGGGIPGMIRQFGALQTSVSNFGNLLGVVRGGLLGLGVVKIGEQIHESVKSAGDEFLRLNRLAKATNFDPNTIKAFQDVLEDTGAGAETANKAFVTLSQELAKSRENARAAGSGFQNNVKVLRGMGEEAQKTAGNVTVLRGAQNGVLTAIETLRGSQREGKKDFSDLFAAAGLDASRYKDTLDGTQLAFADLLKRIVQLKQTGKVDQANLLSFGLFGKRLGEMGEAIERASAGFEKLRDDLEKKGLNVRPEQMAAADALQKSAKDAQDEWERLRNTMFDTFVGSEIRANEWSGAIARTFTGMLVEVAKAPATIGEQWTTQFGSLTGILQQRADEAGTIWSGMLNTMLTDVGNIMPQIEQQFGGMFTALGNGFVALGQQIGQWAQTAWQQITAVASRAASALGQAAGSLGDAAPFPPMAAGGIVRGPGTGTSDSILARLSNGEFVVNAAATSRNLALLRAINSGLSTPRRRFATGGLVGALPAGGSGTPVHLHIGGSEFALSGSSGVVDQLVRESKRQHVRSAGVKPSWYGGR